MTLHETLKAIRVLGMRARYNSELKEYRIAFPDNSEASAYYTDNSDDAWQTANIMYIAYVSNRKL
jgi:hypothetical protein